MVGDESALVPPDTIPPALRASDAERMRMVARLQALCADGVLTLDEFSDRVTLVWDAKTRADLVAVADDLPAQIRDASTPAPGPAAQSAAPERRTRRQRTRWAVAILGSSGRRGRWRAGERCNTIAVMGECTIDLRRVELDTPELVIDALSIMGAITVIVPPGVDVELGGLAILGSKDMQVRGEARPGMPRVRVRALAIMGSVDVVSRRERPPGALPR